jgi:hypothetical protein
MSADAYAAAWAIGGVAVIGYYVARSYFLKAINPRYDFFDEKTPLVILEVVMWPAWIAMLPAVLVARALGRRHVRRLAEAEQRERWLAAPLSDIERGGRP